MRVVIIAATISILAASGGLAHADSVADLSRPSSTVRDCVNTWNPTDPKYGQTCEAIAAVLTWRERASAIDTARDVIVGASRDPSRTDKEAVRGALVTLSDAADAITSSIHPQRLEQNTFASTLSWMRKQFEAFHLPIPDSLGDGFQAMARGLDDPRLLIVDRNAIYDRSASMADALSEAVAETTDTIAPDTNAAVMAAHQAAMAAAQAADNGHYDAAAASAAIVKAAGPDHAAIADGQFRILQASIARHPNQASYLARTGRHLARIPDGLIGLLAVCVVFALWSFKTRMIIHGFRAALEGSVLFILAAAASWLPVILLVSIGVLPGGLWPGLLWLVLFTILFKTGHRFVPARLKQGWFSLAGLFGARQVPSTHGTAHFSEVEEATAGNHLAPSAPPDAFALGWLHGTGHRPDGRFRQDGHILTCAPTGAGKGIGAVIPNLLDYPGSAFVLDFKGENYAVTARARREAGQDVFLIDPFGVTGAPSHGMNWLDALNPEDPDVVSLAGAMAEMLVVSTGRETDPHWTETARELLRGLLIYVAGLPPEQRSMSALRAILTGSEDDWAEVLADMLADPLRGHRIVARTATAHLNRPEKERGSVLSTLVRHTAWLDDPRLARAFSRSDFDLRDLKRRRMTVYLALPPDRLRACLGFVRGFIGLALDAMTATPGKPAHRVAFFLDEFGQLGRMDSLADNITMLRGYGAQFWLFVQDLSQLKAVYPRWQSFLANTTQQFFGTADYDTAKYLSDALGQFTVRYRTSSQSSQTGFSTRPGGGSAGSGEHLQGRSLMTPDEVIRLGPARPIVMISGEAPYLLERLNYLEDAPYAGRFDPNPMHQAQAAT
ncbi:type IV secretory system conjugative DNA transfer family protein [Acidisoma silvae]|uniref:Type IV secretory system conjugative DNA transfer family protein n=1 Tax=Acidisoma silvae TaxID=2802396 RepID=A0A963YX05_9PROT|nr:type IV secretory system conjugative DNA transfer family protein [Acidisoma silvae]MCB8878394.1 type IV secretory system conjugative DNA transfer family protein [Acidisoma silvae]